MLRAEDCGIEEVLQAGQSVRLEESVAYTYGDEECIRRRTWLA